ncbi:3 beta-hydroxysteroid dehydrogenase/Delta 5--_4-isomerase type 1-like [Mercenaria mercenaria]|uniref:3 beta-hydroxysteroid dehydrogenase/Delta 5-->4-isomerase type 1-like n=1 Tax=Mercenaria mercenaria TaxID=6596 RepID=UPI00234EE1E6|nr:3 beta-hydroxysteroid dehydrogenase/Delta 5-->4-isomerase type 1-like [Mercenaria mercenaria]
MKKAGTVVLVTGASGFLGKHVVKMLQTCADHAQEVRIVDVVPFINKLGTRNIIDACRKCKVPRLIYCSSIEAVRGKDHINNGTENNTSPPDHFLFKVYGYTKKQAEDLVIQANCPKLSTICLRPSGMYGELEPRLVQNVADSWLGRKTRYFITLNCGKGQADICYVGNCAWAFVCADKTLQTSRSNSAAGNAYFIRDDTPHTNITELIVPIAEEAGFKRFPLQIPVWLLSFILSLMYHILKIVSVVYPVNPQFGTDAFDGLGRVCHFSYNKAKQLLDYHPIYNFQETKRFTAAYLIKMKNEYSNQYSDGKNN